MKTLLLTRRLQGILPRQKYFCLPANFIRPSLMPFWSNLLQTFCVTIKYINQIFLTNLQVLEKKQT